MRPTNLAILSFCIGVLASPLAATPGTIPGTSLYSLTDPAGAPPTDPVWTLLGDNPAGLTWSGDIWFNHVNGYEPDMVEHMEVLLQYTTDGTTPLSWDPDAPGDGGIGYWDWAGSETVEIISHQEDFDPNEGAGYVYFYVTVDPQSDWSWFHVTGDAGSEYEIFDYYAYSVGVPEPATMCMIALGGAVMLWRRRRR